VKFKDGSKSEEKFEDFQHQSHQRRDSEALGRYSGPSYEQWKDRTLKTQRKIDASKFFSQAADTGRRNEGPSHVG
jgi:hypothetical protein